MIGYRTGNLGYVIENLVYIELLRRGYNLSVGKNKDMEIDFIALKGDKKLYMQVSMSVLDESVEKREFAPFYSIKDNYPKYLVTMDRIDMSKDGIIHLNLYDFLMGKEKSEI